jgi:aldose sugar dehydrogenase
MIMATMILVLVFTTSVYSIYAIETTTRSTADKKTYDETTTSDYHTTAVALQDGSGMERIKDNLEVINLTEIPNTQMLPEFIASLINGNLTVGDSNRTKSTPEFILIDNQSGIIGYSSSPSYWKDSKKSCLGNFTCRTNLTTGWKDNTSLQVSTNATTKQTAWIRGKEIGVNPNERYELVTYMKLDGAATNSHIVIEASNETSKKWKQIKQCPSGIEAPLEWRQFSCEVTIPENITKIRPVLIAGWSSQENVEGVTFFDNVYMIRLTDVNFISNLPTIMNDPNLKTEVVTEGLELPTSMAFLGPDDILVLEKNKGTVQRSINGTMLPQPLIDLNVGNVRERGLVGIAIPAKNKNGDMNGTASANTTNTTHVFLYLTESKNGDNDRPEPLSNRLYRYDLENNKLVNPKLLLELPRTSKTIHNGGIVSIGPDNNVYTVVGDLEGKKNDTSTKAQNYRNGPEPDGRSGVLRITQDGQLVNGKGILGDEHPLDMYYAYGIRNSFGMDFDPITGKLWDTENGPNYGDEINLVEPGFNSGWKEISGMMGSSRIGGIPRVADTLEDFGGKGKYSDPEYEWSETVGPTALKFFNSDKLGKQYENDMFVGDFTKGNIYHFELNKERTKLNLDTALEGRLNEKVIFANGFGGVTDLEVGPDGYLYIVSIAQGKIFRIVPSS